MRKGRNDRTEHPPGVRRRDTCESGAEDVINVVVTSLRTHRTGEDLALFWRATVDQGQSMVIYRVMHLAEGQGGSIGRRGERCTGVVRGGHGHRHRRRRLGGRYRGGG